MSLFAPTGAKTSPLPGALITPDRSVDLDIFWWAQGAGRIDVRRHPLAEEASDPRGTLNRLSQRE